jgi:hypothetical protein
MIMRPLTKLSTIVFLSAALSFIGCGGDDDGGGGVSDPPPPALGAQIERMGRAAINTALIGPFEEQATRGAMQDVFNAESDPASFGDFAAEIAGNLAIYDALDTVCGNQLLAGGTVAPGRYDALAGVLADDQLFVNTDSGTCEEYLAVEADFLGNANDDCGGRTPLEDTIDVSYSVLSGAAGVTDGIPEDADGDASSSDFPFYDEPLNLG